MKAIKGLSKIPVLPSPNQSPPSEVIGALKVPWLTSGTMPSLTSQLLPMFLGASEMELEMIPIIPMGS